MFQNISIQMVIDILFAVIVIAVCLKTLTASAKGEGDSGTEKRFAKWREELEALHVSLKDLIGEAAVASNNFDRRLLQRKGELETILSKIEALKAIELTRPIVNVAKNQSKELPNDTWKEKIVDPAVPQDNDDIVCTEYDELLTSRKDKVTVSNLRQAVEEQKIEEKEVKQLLGFSKPLSQEVQKSKQPKEISQLGAHNSNNLANQIDPLAYKIAKRLITEGHEIQVVARKLGLPIAQIRVLDRIIRNEVKTNPFGVEDVIEQDAQLVNANY